ncbi:hypothetical protein AB0945_42955 [Streptomyces sp. NPDC005474]|uniref:hypothetical protein n=1 Tax=Streptomyces sp. NPDC005474 TaxID=3154878 RepID=UPI0034567F98
MQDREEDNGGQVEDRPSEAEQSAFGQLSTLSDVQEVAEVIIGVMSDLFTDHEPKTEDEQRVVFVFSASLERGGTGVDEIDRVLREKYLGFDERPRARWEIEASFEAVVKLADALIASRERPDTQIAQAGRLEMLVRDETPFTVLAPRSGVRTAYEVPAPSGVCTVTVGPPSTALLLRLAMRRTGYERLAVFDRQRLLAFLREQEQQRGLAESAVTRVSLHRLLKEIAAPGLCSLTVDGPHEADMAELENVATSFRLRLAYESDVILAPILDADRLDGSPSQPRLIRQRFHRAPEFVEAIGDGTPTGLWGDRLLGEPSMADEELALRYLRAVAATDPFAAYMGYYHVLEYGMEEAWFEGLRKRVAAAGGSLARPTGDLRSAAKEAAQALGEKTDAVKFFELRALEAVLDALDVRGLAADLDRYLDGASNYFATTVPPFTEVHQLDFGSFQSAAGSAELRRLIAERIYRVRCAITHSKESGNRYSPYTDDLDLGREIPLVRIAAEQLLVPEDHRL